MIPVQLILLLHISNDHGKSKIIVRKHYYFTLPYTGKNLKKVIIFNSYIRANVCLSTSSIIV